MIGSRTIGVISLTVVSCGGAGRERPPALAALPPPPHVLRLERDPPTADAPASPTLVAMKREIASAMGAFQSKASASAPYFLSYAVTDSRVFGVSASLGALFDDSDSRSRLLDVDVRVGSPKEDNTHHMSGGGRFEGAFQSFAQRFVVPLEDDEGAMRARIWLRTEEQYRAAVERLAKVRAQRTVQVAEEDVSDDFSIEPPATHLEPPAEITVDRREWERRARDYSALFKGHPEISESNVSFAVTANTRSFVSSEGAFLQTPQTHVLLAVSAEAKADDGMELRRYETFEASSPAGLPDDAEIRRRVQLVIDDVVALRKAPLAEPWSGPAILDGRAAAVFFHEVFGHRIEGQRQKDEQEGQTFAKKIDQKVMPDFIRVFDDPTIRRLDGVELNGHYLYDDEGVLAQRADLIDGGVLKTFLMSRSPTRGFTRSNGHGRRQAGMRPVARQANLIVDPTSIVSAAELKARLLAEISRQHKPYGLRFREIQGGYTNTTRQAAQSFKVLPVVVYRVYPDGREEMVRGVDLEGTPLTSLSKILAAGGDYQVFNGHCGAESGWVPVSAVSPSLLVEQIETARREKEQDRPPILPAPPFQPAGAPAGPGAQTGGGS
jgi:TldD protein